MAEAMTSLTPDAFGGGANEPLAFTYYGSGLIGKVFLSCGATVVYPFLPYTLHIINPTFLRRQTQKFRNQKMN